MIVECLNRILMKHFGEWLFAARKRANMSQEELAGKANISKNYVSVLERNLPNYKTGALPQPSRRVLTDLAIALGVATPEIMTAWAKYGNGEENQDLIFEPAEDEDELLSFYRGMPETLRPGAKDILRKLMEQAQIANEGKPIGHRPDED